MPAGETRSSEPSSRQSLPIPLVPLLPLPLPLPPLSPEDEPASLVMVLIRLDIAVFRVTMVFVALIGVWNRLFLMEVDQWICACPNR